jgi:hypothetical protein
MGSIYVVRAEDVYTVKELDYRILEAEQKAHIMKNGHSFISVCAHNGIRTATFKSNYRSTEVLIE